MITLDTLLDRIAGLERRELDRWIEHGWVRPEGAAGAGEACLFSDIDEARVALIVELRRLEIDEEAMPLVLGLVDQMYALRRHVRLLRRAILEQSPEVQRSVLEAITAREDDAV